MPATKKNKVLFGFPESINTGSYTAWSKIRCRLYVQGIEITGGAYMQVTKITKENGVHFYHCNIYAGLQSFVEELKSKKLNKNNTGLLDVKYNVASVLRGYEYTEEDLKNPDIKRTAILPVMDWSISKGKYLTYKDEQPEVDIRGLVPAVRIIDVVDAICNDASYMLKTNLKNDSTANNIAMSVVANNLETPANNTFYKGNYTYTTGFEVKSNETITWPDADINNFTRNNIFLTFNSFDYPGWYYFETSLIFDLLGRGTSSSILP